MIGKKLAAAARRGMAVIKRALGNLQVKALLIILIFLFTPVVFFINSYMKDTEKNIIDNTSNLMANNLKQEGDKIENACKNMITLSNIILTDKIILDNISTLPNQPGYDNDFSLRDPVAYTKEDLSEIARVENEINYVTRNVFFNDDVEVILIGANGKCYSSVQDFNRLNYQSLQKFVQQDCIQIVKTGEGRILWNVPYRYNVEGLSGERHISIVKLIRNEYAPQNPAGILMVNLSEKSLKDITNYSENGYFAILNENNLALFSSDQRIENKILTNQEITSRNIYYSRGNFFTSVDGEKYMVNYDGILRFGMCVISMVPYKSLIKEVDALKFKIGFTNIIVFGVFLLSGSILLMNVLKPIKQLLKRMKKMKVGAYSVDVDETENLDDVNGLVRSFDKMLSRIEELVNTVVREQELEKDLRYEALVAQMNPHFLFNTLSSIKWTAKMSGADNVSKMISSLGKLLEVSLDRSREEISLKEELELVKCYVYLQNVRYNDKFDLQIHLEDEEIGDYTVNKFILQPLVENSIIHGFKDKMASDDECRIEITAVTDKRGLFIQVADNGIGMSRERLSQVLAKDAEEKSHHGIGLKNIDERIKLKYGQEYGLCLVSKEGSGTAVQILVPKMVRPDEEKL